MNNSELHKEFAKFSQHLPQTVVNGGTVRITKGHYLKWVKSMVMILENLSTEYSQDFQIQQQELQDLKQFLDKCFAQDSFDSTFFRDLKKFCAYKNISIEELLINLSEVIGFLQDYISFLDQLRVFISQYKSFFTKNLESCIGKTQYPSDFSATLSISFEMHNELFRMCTDFNNFLIDFVSQYWDYAPNKLQKLLQEKILSLFDFKNVTQEYFEKFSRCDSSSKDDYSDSEEIFDVDFSDHIEATLVFLRSLDDLNQTFSTVINQVESESKVMFPDFYKTLPSQASLDEVKASPKEITYISPFKDRIYTLADILEGVTAENNHEAIEWGKPVGEEVW